eukprot:gnl/MRDRNA2_/MRDRNA2_17990_c0_seq2.p1 gnl/MRDRNA2_/MRDRNA2_17990_c0~~gnl/MRDRNA2_/MRDRNA2_17990_c0_seq2.p1  ORF type:complete len:157 (+),score=10.07 gnl/MRDRNA2_/MRDRNA2_17990_c0_seq2:65-535(+)
MNHTIRNVASNSIGRASGSASISQRQNSSRERSPRRGFEHLVVGSKWCYESIENDSEHTVEVSWHLGGDEPLPSKLPPSWSLSRSPINGTQQIGSTMLVSPRLTSERIELPLYLKHKVCVKYTWRDGFTDEDVVHQDCRIKWSPPVAEQNYCYQVS